MEKGGRREESREEEEGEKIERENNEGKGRDGKRGSEGGKKRELGARQETNIY